jgi:6,7-dimethyl-8-ribityllumazine synthase
MSSKYNVAFIQSCWHKDIVDQFRHSFDQHLQDIENKKVSIDYFEAPGVVEVPLLARRCAESPKYDIIVVCGLIVDHGIYRHEFVAQSVLDSTMRIQLDTNVPVIYGILTPQDFLSDGREELFFQHFKLKGEETAHACAKTMHNLSMIAAA